MSLLAEWPAAYPVREPAVSHGPHPGARGREFIPVYKCTTPQGAIEKGGAFLAHLAAANKVIDARTAAATIFKLNSRNGDGEDGVQSTASERAGGY